MIMVEQWPVMESVTSNIAPEYVAFMLHVIGTKRDWKS